MSSTANWAPKSTHFPPHPTLLSQHQLHPLRFLILIDGLKVALHAVDRLALFTFFPKL